MAFPLPNVLSTTSDTFLRSHDRLVTASHEPWEFDWNSMQWTCPHGVSVGLYTVMGENGGALSQRISFAHQPSENFVVRLRRRRRAPGDKTSRGLPGVGALRKRLTWLR